jgi:hypothetical protein
VAARHISSSTASWTSEVRAAGLSLKSGFLKPVYDDAPHLSDQLLLPQIVRGRDIHVLSAFAPSYLFKLIEDLAESKEIESGFVNIVFFVPGDMAVRSESIARFHKYLLSFASPWEVSHFVSNCLQLIDEARENEAGGLQIQILHTSQKKPLTKSLAGIIVDQANPEDYVAFLDAKGGDFNSPVQLHRSWEMDEEFYAQEILSRVAAALNNDHPRAALLGSRELEEWLIYLANYYETNPPPRPKPLELDEVGDEDEADDDIGLEELDEVEEQFLDHLLNLEDFSNEEKYGWFGDSEDAFDLGPVTVVVDREAAIHGHIPPLDPYLASVLSSSEGVARCMCGQKFVRAYGCDEVVWDRWITDYREDL